MQSQESSPVVCESLESRQMLSAVYPSNAETYMWQLVNRARLNPQAEASRYGISISNKPVQPVAMNWNLVDSARKHSAWMLSTGNFSHNEGSVNPGTRMRNAGYPMTGGYGWAENIAWHSNGAGSQAIMDTLHGGLFKSTGHRNNTLNGNYEAVGVGVATGGRGTYVTENYAFNSTSASLTGVVINDKDGDRFYDIGEGLGAVSLTARRTIGGATYSAVTTGSGAWVLNVPTGTYVLTVTGGALGTRKITKNITMGASNQQHNFRSQDAGSTTTTTPTTPSTPATPVASSPVTRPETPRAGFSVTPITSDILKDYRPTVM